jgi:hypothetical protein
MFKKYTAVALILSLLNSPFVASGNPSCASLINDQQLINEMIAEKLTEWRFAMEIPYGDNAILLSALNAAKNNLEVAKILRDLTKEEVISIYRYTQSLSSSVNYLLRSGVAQSGPFYSKEQIEKMTPHLLSGISKFPKLEGQFYRGTHLPRETIADIIKSKRFRDKGFLSTSTEGLVARGFMVPPSLDGWPQDIPQNHDQILFIIQGKSARQLGKFSSTDEREILFLPNTTFEVLSTDKIGSYYQIILNELP